MTINLQYVSTIVYNTTTGQVNYSYPYQFLKKEDLFVTKIDNLGVETLLSLNSDYTIEDKSDYRTGAMVTLLVPIATGNKLAIGLDIEIEQTNQYPSYQAFPSKVTETAFDKISLLLLQFKNTLDRTVKVALDSVGVNIRFPTPVVDRFLVWENTDGKLKNSTYSADTFLTNAQNSATAAANSASAASGSATAAANSASAASGSASAANTSGTNAAASATLAGQYANRATDSAIPGFPTEYSSKHYRDKTQEIFNTLGSIMNGTWLSRVLKESPDGNNYSFTTVPGGDYLVNCANLSVGQKVTANLYATPNIATINRFEVKASAGKEFHLNGNGKDIEGHEGTTAYIDTPCLLEVAFDTQKNKFVIILKGSI